MRSKEITKGFDEIRQLLRENALEAKQRAQEAEQRAQEAEQRFQRIEQQREKNAQAADQRAQAADRRLQRIEQILEENAERMRETDRKINALTDLFTGQWGKLIEALIKPGCVKLFQDRGINVTKSRTRLSKLLEDNRHMEIDILLKNRVEKIAVVIEVKTTLQVSDVNDFIKKFDTFLDFFPKYKGYTLHGTVAGVQIDEGVDKYAYRIGLFVLGLGREGLVRMLNDDKFDPRVFNSSE